MNESEAELRARVAEIKARFRASDSLEEAGRQQLRAELLELYNQLGLAVEEAQKPEEAEILTPMKILVDFVGVPSLDLLERVRNAKGFFKKKPSIKGPVTQTDEGTIELHGFADGFCSLTEAEKWANEAIALAGVTLTVDLGLPFIERRTKRRIAALNKLYELPPGFGVQIPKVLHGMAAFGEKENTESTAAEMPVLGIRLVDTTDGRELRFNRMHENGHLKVEVSNFQQKESIFVQWSVSHGEQHSSWQREWAEIPVEGTGFFSIDKAKGGLDIHLVLASHSGIYETKVNVDITPTKKDSHALLIGCSYGQSPQISPLHGTANDVCRLSGLLTHGFGFGDVKELTGPRATTSAILEQITSLADRVQSGVVVLYFSGHGASQQDDEGFLPSDISFEYRNGTGGGGGHAITGKILLPLLQRMLSKQIAVTLLYDCCYSGRIYRGEYNGAMRVKSPHGLTFRFPNGKDLSLRSDEKSSVVTLSAASHLRPAIEIVDGDGESIGAFTLSMEVILLKILDLKISSWMNYTSLWQLLQREMQTHLFGDPVLEQNGNLVLFTNKVLNKEDQSLPRVTEIDNQNSKVYLDCGSQQFLIPGRYQLQDDTGRETGRVLVTEIENTRAVGSIEEPNHSINVHDSAVLLVAVNCLMKVQLLGEGCEPLRQLIDLHSVLKIENAPSSDAEYLTVKNESGSWVAWSSLHQHHLLLPPHKEGQEALFVSNLLKYAKAKIALQRPPGRMLDVSLELFRLQNAIQVTGEVEANEALERALKNRVEGSSIPEFQAHRLNSHGELLNATGDSLFFSVTNNSTAKIYFTIFIFGGDGSRERFVPEDDKIEMEILDAGATSAMYGPIRVWIPEGRVSLNHCMDNSYVDTVVAIATLIPVRSYRALHEEEGILDPTWVEKRLIRGGNENPLQLVAPFLDACPLRQGERCAWGKAPTWAVIKQPYQILPPKTENDKGLE